MEMATVFKPANMTQAQFAKSKWEQVNSEGYEPDSFQDSMGCIGRLRRVLNLRGMKLVRSKTAKERRTLGAYYVINAETGAYVKPLAVLKVAGPPFLVRTAAELLAGHFYSGFTSDGLILHKDGKRLVVPWEEARAKREAYYGRPKAAKQRRKAQLKAS